MGQRLAEIRLDDVEQGREPIRAIPRPALLKAWPLAGDDHDQAVGQASVEGAFRRESSIDQDEGAGGVADAADDLPPKYPQIDGAHRRLQPKLRPVVTWSKNGSQVPSDTRRHATRSAAATTPKRA